MTEQPRYSPPPPPPGQRPSGYDHAAPGYPGGPPRPGAQGPNYDWRYATQQQAYRGPNDPYRGGPQTRVLPPAPRKRSRAGALTVGALAIAVVSAGIGGGVGRYSEQRQQGQAGGAGGFA